ncbi:MAG: hypothetical protein AAFZ38_01305 [Myxococcota bacterium]
MTATKTATGFYDRAAFVIRPRLRFTAARRCYLVAPPENGLRAR